MNKLEFDERGGNVMIKSVKFRIYPNKKQQEFIDHMLECYRIVYNKGLEFRTKTLKSKHKAGFIETSALITKLKKTKKFAFLKKADAVALIQAMKDLDTGFKKFYGKTAKYPRFKRKTEGRMAYRTINKDEVIRIDGKHIRLPKIGFIKFIQTSEVGRIHNATVERTATGKYYVSLCVDFVPEKRVNGENAIGIDVGIKSFYTDSNGNKVDNPRYLEKTEKKLARERRRLSRKQSGSKNYKKQRIKVAKVYEKIKDQRNDFQQKQSTKLLRENKTVCIENLNVQGIKRNHKLAKQITSVSWSSFFYMLDYKAKWYGNTIIRVPNNYKSSQTCNCCGYQYHRVQTANLRYWECPKCHAKHDRDINASINILNKGLEKK